MKKFSLILFIFISYNSFCQDNDIFFFIKDKNCEIQNCKLDKDGYTNVNISDIENVLEEHIIYYENNGYPLVDAKLENINGNKADLVVNKGEKYTIDSLIISSLDAIKSVAPIIDASRTTRWAILDALLGPNTLSISFLILFTDLARLPILVIMVAGTPN